MHKILKIVALVLSLAGIFFLVRIVAKGDDAIKAAYEGGDSSIVDPMAFVAYIVLGLVLAFVLIFVFKNLFSGGASLKKTLLSVGLFLAVLLIAYLVSGGDPTKYLYNGKEATAGQSQLVGGGLVAFYILILFAAGTMLFSGIKKMIK